MPPKEHSGGPTRGLGRNGSRASLACISCRQRKIKCDVQHKAPGMPCTKCQNAQISCALEPGGDRRRCRGENASESLSSLRGRMQALEDMLLKERGREGGDEATSAKDSVDQGQRDTPAQHVASPPLHFVTSGSESTASTAPVDAAAAMIDLQRGDAISMSTSGTRSGHERQAATYRFDRGPIDDLVRLPTPPSPSLGGSNNDDTANGNENNQNMNAVGNGSNSNSNNENNNSNSNSSNNHNNVNNAISNNNTNNFGAEHQIVFDIGSYHCGEDPMPSTRMQFAPPSADPNPQMDHINAAMQLDYQQHQPRHTHSISQTHRQPTQSVDQSRIHVRGALTPSNGDMDSTTETDDGRFYGPTSQPYLHSTHGESPLSTSNEPTDDMSLDIDSMQVRRLLFKNYWAMHSLAAKVIVNKKRFMADRTVGKRSQYYSTFLENALLACATRTSTSRSMRELGQRFLERARSEVLHELEHLNVASMQGFLLLSDYEATRGRDRLGWMYCGIACRSLYDLGLHENTREHRLGSVDVISRHSVFLTSFVYDQLWSLYLGRPSSISLAFVRTARLAAKDVTVPEELDAWVSLCVMISKVTETLNSSPWTDVTAYDRRLSELAVELGACFEHLPTRLRYEEGSTFDLEACAYALNIQHCGLRIVLHRNSIRLRQERRSEFENSNTQQSTEHESLRRQSQSARIVHQNAIRVAKLIRTYKQIYGVEKVVTIMLDNMYVASTALISHILSQTHASAANSDKDVQWLRALSETLEEVQKYYPITTVMISTLSRLVEGTSLSDIFRVGRRGSIMSKESPLGGIAALSIPPLSMAGWGSREAYMNGFTFDIEPPMDTTFNVDEDPTQYFQNPVIGASPPWGIGFPR